ncbi:MAG: FKBP-type peptidyl-prolyl cis-trans isomerase [Prevotella sp.]|nr:FKBP-type peptidyl-prolyl cis-trans isomerase [Prevotella sp.]MDO4934830.1 FKBP-type peptidyl-prolyl cis-trans isomerase [Prevotella sp.]
MEKPINKYITVDYQLYTVDGDKTELVEKTTADRPFQFISGFGVTLDAFEKHIVALAKDETFDFTLTKDEAYGDYEAARVLNLERQMFCINGHFDHEHIYKDAIIPLQNEDGNRFYGRVLEIGTDSVKIDLNHPLAGKTLNFKGCVTESREATNDEIQGMINRLSGEGCGCGCHDGCHGDCGDGDCEDGCHGGGCHDGGCGCH